MKTIIETERLLLREVDLLDKEDFFEMDSDPEVQKHVGNRPVKSLSQVTATIKSLQEQYKLFGTARLTVVHKATNEVIGWAGIKYFDEIVNNQNGIYELGYRFKRKHWGYGYATEAAKAVLEYAFNTLQLSKVVALTELENDDSKKVLKKLKFKRVETFYFHQVPADWFELSKEEWSAQNQV